ncbi:MAG: hypothetical protein PHG69_02205 [Candidatus Omnitrophica bacterium]|nr:hypothetical protein [Candidatus Omnitrophota bacterium]
MIKKRRIGVLFFVFFLLLFINDSSALHFRIDRGKTRVRLPPGWSDGGVIKVDNVSADPIDIRVYVGDWIYSDQDGSKDFLPFNTDPKSCSEWIKFYPAYFTIPAHGSQKVNYVVAIPKDAIGGHYSALFFEVESGTTVDAKNGAMVKVYNRLASLFYVEPEGTIERKAEINDVKIEKTKDTIEIKADFSNTGNIDIITKGIFDIIDEEGVVFARGEFNEIYTMQQDKAKLSAKSNIANFPAGQYDLIFTFDIEGEILVKEYKIDVASSGKVTSIKETN